MLELIKKYWDLVFGLLFGILTSWLVSFELNKIQTIYSFVILLLVFIGLFKVIRSCIDTRNKRDEIIIDKAVNSLNYLKAINIAENPTKTGEEIGQFIIDTSKKGNGIMKKIFTWIKRYWQQVLGLCADAMYLCLITFSIVCDKLNFILSALPEDGAWRTVTKVLLAIVAVVLVALDIRNQVEWVGIGTIEEADKYIAQKIEEKREKLTPEARKSVTNSLKALNNSYKELKGKVATLTENVKLKETAIEGCKQLMSMGIGDQNEYTLLLDELSKLKNDLAVYTKQKDVIEEKIESYKKVL